VRSFFLLAILSSMSGWAQILADANGNRARVELTSDGFSRVEFSYTDFVEKDHDAGCKLLNQSIFRLPDPRPNSGPIVITAGTHTPVNVSVEHRGVYRDAERRSEPVWNAGDTIVVSAPGHSAPPFRIELTAPLPIVPIEPPAQDANEAGPQIWALKDFPITWAPAPSGMVVAQIMEVYSETGSDRSHLRQGIRRIRCEFDARAGRGIVPQALIAELPVGNAVIYISAMSEKIVDVQGWQIRVRAYTDAVRERHALIDARPPRSATGEE
jgi:hypothetical protein